MSISCDSEDIFNLENALSYYKSHKKSRPYQFLLLDVRDECKLLFEFFYLNNYEITTWEGYYLELWSKDKSKPYIPSDVFLNLLGINDIPIMSMYFNVFENKITVSVFLQFLIIFTFCTNPQVISLMLNICNIHSNIFVDDDQVLHFCKCLIGTRGSLEPFKQWLAGVDRIENKKIKLSSLVELVMMDPFLKYPMVEIRNKLIENIVTYSEYKIIFDRKVYYEHMNYGDINCNKYIDTKMDYKMNGCYYFCLCCSTSPHPLYVNYLPLNLLNCEECLLCIKQKFGYSVRPVNFQSYKNSSMKYMLAENRNSSRSFRSNKNSLVSSKVVKEISFKRSKGDTTKYSITVLPHVHPVVTDPNTPV